jgi:hypothetical protein
MTVTMHTCRGNFRSTLLASGGYEDRVVEGGARGAPAGDPPPWSSPPSLALVSDSGQITC